jgi:molecular chaperone HtpG
MRRMKDMSRYQQGMGFYAQMPDAYNLVLNADHPLIKKVIADETAKTAEALKPVLAEIKGQEARLTILRQEQNKKKPEEITQEEKDDLSNTQKAIDEHKNQKKQIIADAAKDNKIVHQLIDLALLQNGMLRGEALDKFLKRSVELIG